MLLLGSKPEVSPGGVAGPMVTRRHQRRCRPGPHRRSRAYRDEPQGDVAPERVGGPSPSTAARAWSRGRRRRRRSRPDDGPTTRRAACGRISCRCCRAGGRSSDVGSAARSYVGAAFVADVSMLYACVRALNCSSAACVTRRAVGVQLLRPGPEGGGDLLGRRRLDAERRRGRVRTRRSRGCARLPCLATAITRRRMSERRWLGLSERSRSSAAASGATGAAGSTPAPRRGGAKEVVVLPSAAAFEHPDRVVERATTYFEGLGVKVTAADGAAPRRGRGREGRRAVRKARFVYIADGSPLHLRSVLKGSALWDAMLAAYHAGGCSRRPARGRRSCATRWSIPAAARTPSASAWSPNLAVFPYHGTAADHLRERSIDLLPRQAQARRHRRGDGARPRPRRRRGASPARASVTVYQGRLPRRTQPERRFPASRLTATACGDSSASTAVRRRCRHDLLLRDRHLLHRRPGASGGPSPLAARASRSLRHVEALGHRAERWRSRAASVRPRHR